MKYSFRLLNLRERIRFQGKYASGWVMFQNEKWNFEGTVL